MDDVVGTAEAARQLGISPQRVRALWLQGLLPGRIVANRLLLDRLGVVALAERDRPATRPLSARNAWTLLSLLGGEASPWASASEVSRLRALAFAREDHALAVLLRARARTLRLAGAPGVGRYLLREGHIVAAGATLAHRWTDLVVDGITEVYASQATATEAIERLRFWEDPQGPIILHAIPDALGVLLRERKEMPAPVVAIDLLDSDDPRSNRAGAALWGDVVQRWRRSATPLRAHRKAGLR